MPGFGSLAPGVSPEDDLLNQYYDPGTGLPAPGPDRYRPRRPWVVEPDLLETQTGLRKYPPGITTNEAGEPVSAETGEPATVVRRPSVLPITSTPEGPKFVKPKVADVLPYILGGPVGEGFGPVSRLVSAKKPGLGLPLEAAQLAGVRRQLPPAATPTAETPPSEPPMPAQRPLPDVGRPAISPGPQISAGVPWAMKAADRLGISPEAARDLILSGKAGAGLLAGGVLGGSAFGSLIPREERQ
jgi:hypothetical protein